ncbi:MAG: hypothetical protein RR015_05840 [Bacteroidales bacterium]
MKKGLLFILLIVLSQNTFCKDGYVHVFRDILNDCIGMYIDWRNEYSYYPPANKNELYVSIRPYKLFNGDSVINNTRIYYTDIAKRKGNPYLKEMKKGIAFFELVDIGFRGDTLQIMFVMSNYRYIKCWRKELKNYDYCRDELDDYEKYNICKKSVKEGYIAGAYGSAFFWYLWNKEEQKWILVGKSMYTT